MIKTLSDGHIILTKRGYQYIEPQKQPNIKDEIIDTKPLIPPDQLKIPTNDIYELMILKILENKKQWDQKAIFNQIQTSLIPTITPPEEVSNQIKLNIKKAENRLIRRKIIENHRNKYKLTQNYINKINNQHKLKKKPKKQLNTDIHEKINTKLHSMNSKTLSNLVYDVLKRKITTIPGNNTIKKSDDPRYDGIIHLDNTNDNKIYYQTRKNEVYTRIGDSDIYDFIKILKKDNVNKAIFISVFKITDNLRNDAKNEGIILIDSKHLVDLMVEVEAGITSYDIFDDEYFKKIRNEYRNS